MNKIIHILALLLAGTGVHAQLFIENGATVYTTGAAVVTLQHTNLVNNGTYFQATGGKTIFAGPGNDTISGTVSPLSALDTLEIAKQGNGRLVLLQDLKPEGALKFTSGILDLHGHIVNLGPNAALTGETETSYATDTLYGGYLAVTRSLNAPVGVNPGNLGAIITSAQNLGATTIRRGHMSQLNAHNAGSSITRYYDILPANNTNLGATLRILYRDGELNGLTESQLEMWKSTDTVTWTNTGSSSKSAAANYVERNGIQDFSRWTLSVVNSPLPLQLTRFDAACDNGRVNLAWTTAQETKVSRFVIQYSTDALTWQDCAVVAFNAGTHGYTYTAKQDRGYYRLAVIDRDGSARYSRVVYAACDAVATGPELWPNPVAGRLFLAFTVTAAAELQMKLFDAKGALVYSGRQALQPGRNQLGLETQQLPAGIYWLTAAWEGNRHTFKVVKQ
ncbi:T9SS type A sorting domain-containing protein [Taibaiella chishuiensis]|uniref:Putative secreted protein (Por secretion system target) n=1 Tax=Taibaiella chishuiensis TaxID=1434707 RepID=A0A2P8DC59_9BACT|nr:T9SS type A sorting domain-containing protein [Taibaiella chishuiensis]PSK94767.1 putative secreted protein (Por secretion system target) [Taibaiella chishuiensis]